MVEKAFYACWAVLLAVWWLTAMDVKATQVREGNASQLRHRVPVWAAYCLLIFPLRGFGLDHRLAPGSVTLAESALAITVLGLIVAVWARLTLGRNWSSRVTLKQDHELVQRGPYRYVRNPIYTGLLLMVAGTALAIGQERALAALVLAAIGFWIKLREEEAFMLQQFPESYPAYRRRVKALVPFVL